MSWPSPSSYNPSSPSDDSSLSSTASDTPPLTPNTTIMTHPPIHSSSSHKNSAPGPPPSLPLPALPPLTPTSRTSFDQTAPLLNLSARTARASSYQRPSPTQPTTTTTDNIGWNLMKDEDPLSPIDDHEPIPQHFNPNRRLSHRALDQWHNRNTGIGIRVTESHSGHDHNPYRNSTDDDFRAVLDAFQNDLQSLHIQPMLMAKPPSSVGVGQRPRNARRLNSGNGIGIGNGNGGLISPGASTYATAPNTPISPRNSIASDLISLSETSRSLKDLSKRISGQWLPPPPNLLPPSEFGSISKASSANMSFAEDAYDPFEYDRFEADPPKTSPTVEIARPILAHRSPSLMSRSSDDSSGASRYPMASVSVAPPKRPPPLRTVSSTLAQAEDLKAQSQNLATKRADLEARRAELLGLPTPSRAKSSSSKRTSLALTIAPPSARQFSSSSGPRSDDLESESGCTASSIRSGFTVSTVRTTSSSATARPPLRKSVTRAIYVEPPSSSPSGTTTFGGVSRPTSPSSMTFGGDCQSLRKVALDVSPPPPVPELPSLSSYDDGDLPPPVPEKDYPVSFSKSLIKSPTLTSDTYESVPSMQTLRREESSSRASSSTTGSLTTPTPGNLTYPAHITASPEGSVDEHGSIMSRPDSYYYSAPVVQTASRGVVGGRGSVSAGVMVEGWANRDRALGTATTMAIRSGSGGLMSEALHEEVEEVPVALGEVSEEEEDDDSSLDLHTPLPDMLVRAGVLSSRSAIIASGGDPPNKKEETAAALAKGVKGKVLSRSRLVRHRDGRNLGLGLGLTTGLGWSDSEDEDAPSPLRSQLSQIILSKKTSQASIATTNTTLSTSTSNSGFSARRESTATTASSVNSHQSGKPKSVLKNPSSNRTSGTGSTRSGVLSPTTSLRSSQSVAYLPGTTTTRGIPRQNSVSSGLSQSASKLQRPRSPSTSTSGSASSSAVSMTTTPMTSASNSPNIESVLSRYPGSTPDLYSLTRQARNQSVVEKAEVVSRPEVRRTQSSSGASSNPSTTAASGASSIARPSTSASRSRSRAGSSAMMPPPSAYPKSAAGSTASSATVTPAPASGRSTPSSIMVRKRTGSSASSSTTNSSIPLPQVGRERATSTSSVSTTASGARRSKSLASLKNGAAAPAAVVPSIPSPPLPSPSSISSSGTTVPARRPSLTIRTPETQPGMLGVMTVGSLAFPSPPPLSPAVVNMRMAQMKNGGGSHSHSTTGISPTVSLSRGPLPSPRTSR